MHGKQLTSDYEISLVGRAVAWARRRWFLTLEAWVQSQERPRKV